MAIYPGNGVDQHLYHTMEDILACVRRIETTVSHLVDRQIIQGIAIDRLLHTDGQAADGPVIDPQD